MARVTRGHAITAIIFGVIEVLMGIAIIVASFVAASKVSNALYSPYWAGFVAEGKCSYCMLGDVMAFFEDELLACCNGGRFQSLYGMKESELLVNKMQKSASAESKLMEKLHS